METFDYKVRFPKDLEKQIKAQAEKNGVSVNQFVISAVIAVLQPVQPQTVTEQPKETPVAGSKSPLDEQIALMQANDRLHEIQAKIKADRAKKESGQNQTFVKHPPKWAGLPGQRPDESNSDWVDRKTAEANEIYKSAMERLKAEKESEDE